MGILKKVKKKQQSCFTKAEDVVNAKENMQISKNKIIAQKVKDLAVEAMAIAGQKQIDNYTDRLFALVLYTLASMKKDRWGKTRLERFISDFMNVQADSIIEKFSTVQVIETLQDETGLNFTECVNKVAEQIRQDAIKRISFLQSTGEKWGEGEIERWEQTERQTHSTIISMEKCNQSK